MAETSEDRTEERPGEGLPEDLEKLRAELGRGLHQEVKEELKDEAARPQRMRTKLYSLLGAGAICAFLAGLWLLLPGRSGVGPRPAPRSGQNPIAAVRRAIEGPDAVPGVPASDREAMEARRLSLEHELALRAFASHDAARKARTEFDDAVKAALAGEAGRHVALSDELVAQFRSIVSNRELEEARRMLDAPPREGTPDRTLADRAAERYSRARFQLRVLLEHAVKAHPRADVTLDQAIRGYPVIFPCDSRYLNGTRSFDASSSNILGMR